MTRGAAIASAGLSCTVDLDRAVLLTPAGHPILTPNAPAVARWRLLDRSPCSARLEGLDASGAPVALCRFELDDHGLAASLDGAPWLGHHPRSVRLSPEVLHGHVPLQDRA